MTPAAFISACAVGSVIGVLGMPGTGKTRTVQQLDAAGALRRRVVFDPYAREDRLAWNRGERERTPWSGKLVTVSELRSHPELLDREPLKLVVTQDFLDEETIGEDFEMVARLVWSTGGIDLVLEEFGLYGREAMHLANRISSGGAHTGLRCIAICQSLGRVQKDSRRNLNRLVVYAQAEDDDIDSLRARCGKKFAARVQQLRPGDSPLFWSLGDRTE